MPVNALVLGNGRSGRAAAELLRREGAHVVMLDGDDAWPGGAWDMCVTSPGIPLGHPWQAAARGAKVTLYEMRPVESTPAHKTGGFAELVCSNSLRAAGLENAVGVLKEELRRI